MSWRDHWKYEFIRLKARGRDKSKDNMKIGRIGQKAGKWLSEMKPVFSRRLQFSGNESVLPRHVSSDLYLSTETETERFDNYLEKNSRLLYIMTILDKLSKLARFPPLCTNFFERDTIIQINLCFLKNIEHRVRSLVFILDLCLRSLFFSSW